MNGALRQTVERLIEEQTGAPARVRGESGAGGGCISNAQVLELEDGRRFFLKSNPGPLPGMFPREAEGLRALAAPGAIRVPGVIGAGDGEGGVTPFILLEHIETGSRARGFSETFGRQFALLHKETRTDRFGFDHDNYIGSTPQPNGWMEDWAAFWRERRIGFQLDLARKQGLSDSKMNRLGDGFLERLDSLIGEPEEPGCLLHGDLWGGNYMVGSEGEPVLIDPAAYYGRREADLGMTFLFGGFDAAFYDAYDEAWPLADGWRARIDIYKLYHLLNHLNLFGSGYYSGCVSILRQFQ